MPAMAKCLIVHTRSLLQRPVEILRDHYVHLTLTLVVAIGWTAAWARSVEPPNHRALFPALRRDEVARFVLERDQWRRDKTRLPRPSSIGLADAAEPER